MPFSKAKFFKLEHAQDVAASRSAQPFKKVKDVIDALEGRAFGIGLCNRLLVALTEEARRREVASQVSLTPQQMSLTPQPAADPTT